jgi:anaerobic magnesium-protoporphyrin IX monomethyl ester cyclase
MKVILIQSPSIEKRTVGPPIGLAYIAGCLEKEGHKVKIIDTIILNYSLKEIEKELKKFDPDVIGISTVVTCFKNAIEIVKIAKKINQNCLTVLGGSYPTISARKILENNKLVDIVIRGEGEITFVELLKNKKFNEINGISFRLDNKIVVTKDREFIQNLDDLPFPAYHLLPMEKYKIKDGLFELGLTGKPGKYYTMISTSRGCPYGCIFCSSCILWGKKCRVRTPENIIKEINYLYDKFRIRKIDFMEDTFTLDEERTKKICKLLRKENLDISWICTTRVDKFKKETAIEMKKAGCDLVCFGLESGVQRNLDFLNKGFTLEDSIKAVKTAKDIKIPVIGSFIIGIPGETREMLNQTISFAKKLKLHSVRFPLLTPFPGTKLYENLKKNNSLLTDDFSFYIYYHPIIKLENIKPDELIKLQRFAGLKCNLNLSTLLSRFRNLYK